MTYKTRPTSRVVAIHNNQILLIERWQGTSHYYSIPGGGIEAGETAEDTAIRETYEETSVKVNIERLIYKFDLGGFTHQIFLANYISGNPKLQKNSEEMAKNLQGQNRYYPLWLDVSKLKDITFGYTDPVRQQLLTDLKDGFGSTIKSIISDNEI